ncbi:hypothetical protein AVEN_119938-1 [Araneus ventricosus]|uniref:Uncharacterized protein n=1 Tax=Araneus ventricosus TaxID=182803 RepID=A0A4Y2N6R6_ARAVE|nr:hypothetical protein AVEN_119938-1 [Araneus ventricosus]
MVLSNDQQYLYDICLAISRSEYYSDLALRKPAPVAHFRRLTTAGRILRLYVTTDKPIGNLIILATYIMKWLKFETPTPKVPGSNLRFATVVTRKNTQRLLSVPLLDGSTKKSHQFHLPLHPTDGSTSTSTPISPKFKVYDHFIAQSLHMPAHTQMGGNNLRICTQRNYRFLDIQIISNKLGVAPVFHRAVPSYSDVYKSVSASGHSFCLVVEIRASEPKDTRFQSSYCHKVERFAL